MPDLGGGGWYLLSSLWDIISYLAKWQIHIHIMYSMGFPRGSLVKNLPANLETLLRSLGWEDPLEEGMATHSSTLAWRIPWTEKPGGLQSMGLQRIGHGWAANTSCMPLSLGFGHSLLLGFLVGLHVSLVLKLLLALFFYNISPSLFILPFHSSLSPFSSCQLLLILQNSPQELPSSEDKQKPLWGLSLIPHYFSCPCPLTCSCDIICIILSMKK